MIPTSVQGVYVGVVHYTDARENLVSELPQSLYQVPTAPIAKAFPHSASLARACQLVRPSRGFSVPPTNRVVGFANSDPFMLSQRLVGLFPCHGSFLLLFWTPTSYACTDTGL
jgi:hypothetical protein